MYSIDHGHSIVTESYFDGKLSSSKQEIEISMFSTKESLLRDIIDALAVISSAETDRLNIDIKLDQKGRYLLRKKWTVQ